MRNRRSEITGACLADVDIEESIEAEHGTNQTAGASVGVSGS